MSIIDELWKTDLKDRDRVGFYLDDEERFYIEVVRDGSGGEIRTSDGSLFVLPKASNVVRATRMSWQMEAELFEGRAGKLE